MQASALPTRLTRPPRSTAKTLPPRPHTGMGRWLLMSCILLGALFAPLYSAEAQSCKDTVAWAKSLKVLPKTYEEFSNLPLSYRKAVYSRLSFGDRETLWHQQWQTALEKNDFTPVQRAVLLDALQIITAETFGALAFTKDWRHQQARAQVEALDERAEKEFGKPEATRLFRQLGPVRALPVLLVDPEAHASHRSEACMCELNGGDCPRGYYCTQNAVECDVINGGCRIGWWHSCNGLCTSINVF